MRMLIVVAAFAAVGMVEGGAWAGASAAQKCEGTKNDVAGKYATCLGKAEKGLASSGDSIRYAAAVDKCVAKYSLKWKAAETAAGAGTCPSEGDEAAVEEFVDFCTEGVAEAVAGGDLPPRAATVRTGLTTCYDASNVVTACAGTGQDADQAKGVVRTFVDNLDGTIRDEATGLTWEKLDDSNLTGTPGVHDQDNVYTWTQAFAKVALLNSIAFAGHSDWRLPNLHELFSLVNLGAANAATFDEFRTACVPGCSTSTCSCTRSQLYWTSSTRISFPSDAWVIAFNSGVTSPASKTAPINARAVRGGQ